MTQHSERNQMVDRPGYEEFRAELRAQPGDRFGIVASEFNQVIVDPLVAGARAGFHATGVEDASLTLVWVPGALEIAGALHQLISHRTFAGIIAVGAVVRGETSHYDVVVHQSASQLMTLAATSEVPIVNAILTVETIEQGLNRAGGKDGNKGFDAALSLVRLCSLYRQLQKG
ncbi:MAG: 6,7-dimethyl-8-ribityllumazine synthase [Ferrimicrobium sp.]|uniref:6,7-dimethyl-8-ribityllumazine synthase n=1 Tax=Ferrimicrobium acidiphilum TaxID=121039 RepID=A0ABV3Y2H3_9ACTN|nr:6,7-dimethyl-8-ribityllumazine synthase [Ferrimicrobium sp.]